MDKFVNDVEVDVAFFAFLQVLRIHYDRAFLVVDSHVALTILNFDLNVSHDLVNLTAENRPDRYEFLKASEDVFEWETASRKVSIYADAHPQGVTLSLTDLSRMFFASSGASGTVGGSPLLRRNLRTRQRRSSAK